MPITITMLGSDQYSLIKIRIPLETVGRGEMLFIDFIQFTNNTGRAASTDRWIGAEIIHGKFWPSGMLAEEARTIQVTGIVKPLFKHRKRTSGS